MAAEWICDGCGNRAPGIPTHIDGWRKPHDWFERALVLKEDGTEKDFGESGGTFKTTLTACSRECIERVATSTGTHRLVLPV